MAILKKSLEATKNFDQMVKVFKSQNITDGRKCHGLFLRGVKMFELIGMERNVSIKLVIDICHKNEQKIG